MSKITKYEMSDVIFAGFAQLSYLNWHNLKASQGKKLSLIFGKDTLAFNQIRTTDYNDMYMTTSEKKEKELKENKLKQEIIQEVVKGNGFKITKSTKGNKEESTVKDYLELSKAKHKIYHHKDPRLFYLYSEDAINAEKKPKYPEFGEWEFIAGFDTNKIHDLSPKQKDNLLLRTYGSYSNKKDITCGFQASVFKYQNNIMITYRGSDAVSKSLLTDWFWTNVSLQLNFIPRALTYAVWVYEWVKSNDKLKNCQIHITGHSMGGALAQYVGVYSGFKHKTVTWNALGIGVEYKLPSLNDIADKKLHYFSYMTSYLLMKKDANIKKIANEQIRNFFIHEDLVANLHHRVGKVISVNKKYSDNLGDYICDKISTPISGLVSLGYTAFVDFFKALFTGAVAGSMGAYHTASNFLPFFDTSGMINLDTGTVSHNFVHNSIKMVCQNNINLIPKVNNKNKIPLGKSLSNASNNRTSNKDNLFWYCLKKQIKEENTDWYDSNILEVGLFNNSKIIAGVPGGDPYPLISNSNKKAATIIKVSNGNCVIKKK